MYAPRASDTPNLPTGRPPGEPADRCARLRFARRLRILRRADFERAMKEGLQADDARMTLWALSNRRAKTRLGLVVGRKHGTAVRRNRIKRVLREAFRLSRPQLPTGLDLVCAPRTGGDIRLESCRESFVRLATRLSRRLAKS